MKRQVNEAIQKLLEKARTTEFEDGMVNEFTVEFIEFALEYEKNAVKALHKIVTDDNVEPKLRHEILKCVGYLEQQTTHNDRFKMLTNCLSHSVFHVRNGAVVGLGFLDDSRVTKYLELAKDDQELVIAGER